MRFVLRTVGVIFLLLVLAAGGLAGLYFSLREAIPELETDTVADTQTDPGVDLQALASARARLTQLRREIGYPSVSVAVAIGGKVVWQEAQGYADLAAKRRATIATPYAIGSVSKSLTAAGVMRLVDRGVLALDVDVRAYVPSFPVKPYAITMRQLLSHQAGIRHYRFELSPPTFSDFGSNVRYASVRDSLVVFQDDPLLFEPDTSFSYSTYGYTLASAAAESAAGVPFLDMMQTEVFGPLGMTSTGGDDKLHPAAGRANDYQNIARDGHVIAAPEVDVSNKWAGGGFRSTPHDLAVFGAAMLDGKVVSADGLAAMFTPRKLRSGAVNPQDYGLGFRVDVLKDTAYPGKSWRAIHHGGVAVGAQGMLMLFPDSGVVVALSANATTQPPARGMFDAASDIAVLFIEGPPR
ncbi:MAG: serine hydrolase domain-containing protein [Alphaproteobacteria bacterium]|nr:serine hydrolase domain-containing protein [Alphaproteobacteria bacterium]